jgi:hypothetical protein
MPKSHSLDQYESSKEEKLRKTFVILVYIMMILPLTSWSQENTTDKEKSSFWSRIGLSLKVYAGGSYVTAGDINCHIQGINDMIKDSPAWDITGTEPQPLHWGFNIGGEAIFSLTSRLGISIGGGFFKADNRVEYGSIHTEGIEEPLRNKFYLGTDSAYYRTGIYFYQPLKDTIRLVANVGIGYYKGNISSQFFSAFPDDRLYSSHKWGGKFDSIGFHGGLGLEIDIISKVSLVSEIIGRYAKLENKSGYDRLIAGLEQQRITIDGILWYIDMYVPATGKTYPQIIGLESEPSHPHHQNPRKAYLDLSGISFRVGIKIKLN